MQAARPPAFTIVMPMHQAGPTIAEALASVRAQSFPDWEARVVDDRSTDDGWDKVAEIAARDPRVHLLRLEGAQGAAAARNLAIRSARGRYIAFLDADDLWLPEKLALQHAQFEAGAHFVFGAYERMTEDGQRLKPVQVPERVTYEDALNGNPIGCLTAAFDTAVCGRAEMPMLDRRQDYALWLRLLRVHGPALGLPEVLARYRVRSGSLSSNKLAAARATWHVLRHAEGLPLDRAVPAFAAYVRGALSKRL